MNQKTGYDMNRLAMGLSFIVMIFFGALGGGAAYIVHAHDASTALTSAATHDQFLGNRTDVVSKAECLQLIIGERHTRERLVADLIGAFRAVAWLSLGGVLLVMGQLLLARKRSPHCQSTCRLSGEPL